MASFPFLLFLSLLTFSLTITTATTATLDVTSAIQTTINLLNPTSFHQQAIQTLPKNTSYPLSFTLHPLSTIHHHDYESLTHARLTHDSHRVTTLTTKLDIAIIEANQLDITKPNSFFKFHEELSVPVTSGMSQGSGEYFARVGFGTPPKWYYMVIDTGSDVNWLQCKPCNQCYEQNDPIFDPAESSTYSELSCNTQQCKAVDITACQSNKCLYQVRYGDGSSTAGKFVTETVSFGRTGTVPKVALGCGDRNEGSFFGSAGVLALGGGILSMPSQLKAKSFSYCFVNRDSKSTSTLEFNTAAPANSITAPLIRNPRMKTYLYVGLTGISVAGRQLSISPSIFTVDDRGSGGAIVDSGTAVSHLQTQAYNALRDAFTKSASKNNLKVTGGVSIFDTCYNLSSKTQVPVPQVVLNFAGGQTLALKPSNYMIPVDSHGTFCLAFAPSESPLSIIGNVQQQGTRVSFDLIKSVVSFSPNSC